MPWPVLYLYYNQKLFVTLLIYHRTSLAKTYLNRSQKFRRLYSHGHCQWQIANCIATDDDDCIVVEMFGFYSNKSWLVKSGDR